MQRTARSDAVLVLSEGRFFVVEIVVEEVGRVKLVVSEKFPDCAVKLIGSGLGSHIYVSAGGDAELGICNLGLDVKLLNRVRRRTDGPRVVEDRVVEYTVKREVILLPALTIDRGTDPAAADGNNKEPLLSGLFRSCARCQ